MRQSAILGGLDRWLASIFDPDRIDDTCAALAAASEPDPATDARQDANRKKIKDCDARLATYRAALEAGTDPALVGRWIAEVQAERATAERALGQATKAERLTKDEVRALVAALGDTVATLQQAAPVDKAEAYRELGIHLTYHPDGTVRVEVKPRVYSGVCRRGDTTVSLTSRSPPSSPWLADAVGGSIGVCPVEGATICWRWCPGETPGNDLLASGYRLAIKRSTRSSWERKGSVQRTVRWAWSLSFRWTQSTV